MSMDTLRDIARHRSEYWQRKIDTHEKEFADFWEAIRQYEEDNPGISLYSKQQIQDYENRWLKDMTDLSQQHGIYKSYADAMKGVG